jgi:hypothetical protein
LSFALDFTHITPFVRLLRVSPAVAVGCFLPASATLRDVAVVSGNATPCVGFCLAFESHYCCAGCLVKTDNAFLASIRPSANAPAEICVVLWSTPLKIAGAVVEFVFVDMVDLSLADRIIIITEGFCYKTMKPRLLAHATPPQADVSIAGMLNNRGNDAFW